MINERKTSANIKILRLSVWVVLIYLFVKCCKTSKLIKVEELSFSNPFKNELETKINNDEKEDKETSVSNIQNPNFSLEIENDTDDIRDVKLFDSYDKQCNASSGLIDRLAIPGNVVGSLGVHSFYIEISDDIIANKISFYGQTGENLVIDILKDVSLGDIIFNQPVDSVIPIINIERRILYTNTPNVDTLLGQPLQDVEFPNYNFESGHNYLIAFYADDSIPFNIKADSHIVLSANTDYHSTIDRLYLRRPGVIGSSSPGVSNKMIIKINDKDLECGSVITNKNSNSELSYQDILRTTISQPFYLQKFKMRVNNEEQVNENMEIVTNSIFGDEKVVSHSILEQNPDYKNRNILDVKFQEKIQIGGNANTNNYIKYKILPHTKIHMIVYYEYKYNWYKNKM